MTQISSQPLSVGNVVTTAFQLYKNRFQPYFLLALKAYFWLLVPIYGWAKFWATSALISRLVYGELVNQPETITGGKIYVNSHLWKFLFAAILLGFITLAVWIVLTIVFIFVFTIILTIVVLGLGGSASILKPGSPTNTIVGVIIIVISTIGLMPILIRFFVFELPLAIEDNINVASTICRSWKLTKSFESHTLSISLVAFLISLPLLALPEIICFLRFRFFCGSSLIAYPLFALLALEEIIRKMFQFLFTGLITQKQIFNLLLWILTLCLGIVSGAMQLSIWQAVKAVVYYDLRTRKEGLGLKLRDRNI